MGLESFPWSAVEAIATVSLVLIGAWQIKAIRKQEKGWKTLEACEKYDQDPVLDRSLRNIAGAKTSGELDKNPEAFRVDYTTVLNYLDGIATGIRQNLYIERIARDHLEPILVGHVKDWLKPGTAARIGIDLDDYKRLRKLAETWNEGRLYFRDSWKWPWRSR
jgi:hypothetical protein